MRLAMSTPRGALVVGGVAKTATISNTVWVMTRPANPHQRKLARCGLRDQASTKVPVNTTSPNNVGHVKRYRM